MLRRLLLSSLLLISFMLLALGIPFWRTIVASERADLRTDLERDAVVLSTLVEDALSDLGPGQDPAVRPLISSIAEGYSRRTGARVVVLDAEGVTVADNESPAESGRSFVSRPEVAAALAGRVGVDQRFSHTLGRSALFVATPVSSGGHLLGAVRLSYTTADMERRIRSRAVRLAMAGALAVVTASAIAVFMARSLARPLAELGRVTRAFGAGALDARAPIDQHEPEYRALAADFNTMAERLETLISAQDAFVADASHQLRSPLTAARLRVEGLAFLGADPSGDAATPTELVADEIEAAVSQLDRLGRIIDGLLALARADRPDEPAAVLPLLPEILARVEFWSAFAEERSIDLCVATPDSTTDTIAARVDPTRFAQVLDNLVANALDASPPSSRIEVSLCRSGDRVLVTVTDEGRGMSDAQIARAFDRLWRADSRRTELSGSGLGLPIARKLAGADRGALRIERRATGGLHVELSYPAVHG